MDFITATKILAGKLSERETRELHRARKEAVLREVGLAVPGRLMVVAAKKVKRRPAA